MSITVGELSKQLQDFLEKNPKRKDDGVFVFVQELERVDDDINEVVLVDFDLPDRVDINIG